MIDKVGENLGYAVELDKVTKRYDNVKSLCEASLQVRYGETVTILGANGSGKSTLLRLVSLQSSPSSGELRLFGESPKPELRRKIGYLAHECLLYGELTVLENLEFYQKMFSSDGKAGEDALLEAVEILKIGRWLHSKTKTLSHGSKKRADIARALLHRPELLILDEPFSGLDPQTRGLLSEYLKENNQNRTVLLSSQDLESAQEFSDKAIVLQNGRIDKQLAFR